MVISFSHDTVFHFLARTGYVATFRNERRKRPNCQTWVNRGRGKSKEFDVRITEVGEFDPFIAGTPMSDLAGSSGFGTIERWREAIQEVHGSDVSPPGWVYFVTKEVDDVE